MIGIEEYPWINNIYQDIDEAIKKSPEKEK